MNRHFFALSLGVGAMLIAAQHAFGQARNCADHAHVVARLAERYGESRQAIGLAANNSVMELFASPESGTWTLTVTIPGGQTCLVAAGEDFQTTAGAASGKDEGA